MFNTKMFARSAVAIALVTVLGLMVPAVSLAAPITVGGTGPDNALAPSGIWQHLDKGQERWYSFTTAGAASDNTQAHVLITLRTAPEGSASFGVWSAAELKMIPGQDPNKPVQPAGQGTVQTQKNSDGSTSVLYGGALFWASSFKESQTLWLQVKQTGDQAADYLLTIMGDAVTFPAATDAVTASTPTTSTTSGATAPSALSSALAAAAGAGPDTALVPNGATMTVQPGKQQWYEVDVPGDSDPSHKPTVMVRLTQINGSAKFGVWDEERLHLMAIASPGTTVYSVGEGTSFTSKQSDGSTITLFNGDLFWLGDAKIGNIYYVIVEPSGSAAATYSLSTSTSRGF